MHNNNRNSIYFKSFDEPEIKIKYVDKELYVFQNK